MTIRPCKRCNAPVLKGAGIVTNIGIFHEACWDAAAANEMKNASYVNIQLERVISIPRGTKFRDGVPIQDGEE